MKRVLALYYTQTGQLEDIVTNFTRPFLADGVQVETVRIWPASPYPFPWTSDNFFAEMPESVLSVPVKLAPFTFNQTSYDLIIFAYQPWFLSPSIPANSILQHPAFLAVVKNTPVVTLIGSRNMWLSAQERVKKSLAQAGAQLVGNVALADRNNNTISAVTILYWMLTGKKDRYMNIFPRPGVSDEDIRDVSRFGEIVKQYLQRGNFNHMQEELIEQNAVDVRPNLMFIESRATKLFSIWANLIIKKKNRKPWVVLFKYYLLIALFIVAPIVVTINGFIFKPFLKKRIIRKKNYYLALN